MLLETGFSDLAPPERARCGTFTIWAIRFSSSSLTACPPLMWYCRRVYPKGEGPNELSLFWFRRMADIVRNHVLESDVERYPATLAKYADGLAGRSMIVKKAKPIPAECVVRGYLAGSGWTE